MSNSPVSDHPHHAVPDPTPAQVHAHAAAARARKRAEAEAQGIDEGFIDNLVESFYTRIRADELLGPIFAARIADWPLHLGRMKAFWRSILHNSGEYAGNPMEKHIAIPGLEAAHFVHWLNLFYETLSALEASDEGRSTVGNRARLIADSLLTGITVQRDGLLGARAGEALPRPR